MGARRPVSTPRRPSAATRHAARLMPRAHELTGLKPTLAVEFVLRSPLRRAVMLAAAHGMTDVAAPALLVPYSIIALPVPGWMTTTLFSMASVVHFAADIGLGLSCVMHAALTAAAVRHRDASFFAMSLYFVCVHTPLHYMRLLADRRVTAVVAGLAITAGMALISAVPLWSSRMTRLLPKGARMLAPFSDHRDADGVESGPIHVTHMMQRLVFAHVVVEVLRCISVGEPWLPPVPPPWTLR